jgi:hypothetical protein
MEERGIIAAFFLLLMKITLYITSISIVALTQKFDGLSKSLA